MKKEQYKEANEIIGKLGRLQELRHKICNYHLYLEIYVDHECINSEINPDLRQDISKMINKEISKKIDQLNTAFENL